ncbi:MAG TPA: GFA family protein [Burkholderiales bacterium]|nr:GFA family protein [Burkholderiales bacterium]
MVTLPLEGGCQCGALRYQVTQPPLMIYNCHCTNCQKIGGAAFSTPATILEASFSFTKGEPKTTEWKSDAGNSRYGWFCGDCGSRIAHGQTPSIGMLSLRAGTFDDTSWVEPVGDIWMRSAQPWVQVPESRVRCEQQPTDYGPFFERYRAQKRFPE